MRIDPNQQYLDNVQSNQVENTKGQGAAAPASVSTPDTSSIDAGDTVQLSGTLSQIQQLKTQLSNTPDVRTDRVAALRQQILQGTYQPSNEQIANAMMSEAFGNGSQR
jgi:negative regulator of flagellin synthesis FlgM